MTWWKWLISGLIVLAVVAITIGGLKEKPPPAVEVQVGKVKKVQIVQTVTGAGKVEASTTVKISSNLSGDLVDLPVKIGRKLRSPERRITVIEELDVAIRAKPFLLQAAVYVAGEMEAVDDLDHAPVVLRDHLLELGGKGLAGLWRLAGHFRAERWNRTAMAGIVTMRRVQIGIDDGRKPLLRRRLLAELAPALGRALHDVLHRFDDERFAGIEMRVEAAMGQARFLHQVGHADAVCTLFAKPHRGPLHDPFVGFLLVLLGVTHGPSDKMFIVI